jgi:phosphatidylserine/phosphatidylglycerophosphate/cardiolipin synthase-like enzyme
VSISTAFTAHISAYFNKGVAAAQWVSRDLDKEEPGENRKAGLNAVIAKIGDATRNELGGLLRLAVLGELSSAAAGQLYAALYELNDPELIAALEQLGAKAHVVLGNGAFSSSEPDENAAIRQQLKTQSSVQVFDREVSSGHFAHNKFAVVCDAAGNAQNVLTGSTNWTMTGLCSQVNNGVVIDDAPVANRFLTQWNSLKAAGNEFPSDLIAANSQLQQFTVDDVTVTPWFAPTGNQEDLDYARTLIANAKQAALFLFFNPGIYQAEPQKETLLQDILDRRGDSVLYIRGVVNQEIPNLTEESAPAGPPPVTLVGATSETPLSAAVLVPANIKKQFGHWEDEALGASMVMVHSKVVVLDPWGDHPVLMTGSHNLGVKASSKNDDNLVIFEGPAAAALASAYAINIIAIYHAYHWNSYVTQHANDPKAWKGLEDDDAWQTGHLTGDNLQELRFWTQTPA